jgi:glutamate carboxypeptidase
MAHPDLNSLKTRLAGPLEALATSAPAMIARTEVWSAVNSGSLELTGLSRMAALLEDALGALPGRIERIALVPTPRVRADGVVGEIAHGDALRLSVRPDAPIQIALTGHYDTVFPATSPFQASRRDGDVLNGPGVADMKGGLVLMLEALAAFERSPELASSRATVGYTVLLSPDEEIGSPASAPLLAELGAKAHFGMVYEPAMADGALAGARKGSGNFAVIFTGRAAHVGRDFASGRSAILAAAELALLLDGFNGKREGVTFNTGAIEGGAPVNMVPPGAVLRFNVRAPDAESSAWSLARLEDALAKVRGRDGVGVALHGGITRAPKPLTPGQQSMIAIVKAAGAALGAEIEVRPSGGVCEGNNLAAAGCPNIDTLGPKGGNLHSPEEFALMSSFGERAQLSLLLLAGAATGAFDARALRA